MSKPVNHLVIAAASALPGADGAPAWIMLLPAGAFTFKDGRGTYHTGDLASMQAIVERSLAASGKAELMIDYDHQLATSAKAGGTAPAAGWVKKLEARADGIWAQVEWTAAAAEKIRGLEYRYISPFFTFDKKTHAVDRIINAGLVNAPAIDFEAIAAAMADPGATEKDNPTMKNIAKALGLAETASEETIVAAITSNQDKIAAAAGLKAGSSLTEIVTALVSAAGTVATAAGLKPGATTEEVTAAIASLGGKAGDMVPKASFDQLSADFKALKASIEHGKADAAVAAAIDAGKVTPAQKDWATQYARSDLKGFDAYVANAPVLTAAQLGDGKKPGAAGDQDDPAALAAAATRYQNEQAKAGIVVPWTDAVIHVRDAGSKQ